MQTPAGRRIEPVTLDLSGGCRGGGDEGRGSVIGWNVIVAVLAVVSIRRVTNGNKWPVADPARLGALRRRR
jgi:hypothetical protein